MCFSAGASFGAAAVIGAVGVASLRQVKWKSQFMFAAMPILFSFQQVLEGVLWLSLTNDHSDRLTTVTTYTFLFFAQTLWPAWVPLAFYFMEERSRRKKILLIVSGMGICCSVILTQRYLLNEVFAEIRQHHIFYGIGSSTFERVTSSILYSIAIVAPGYISKYKGMKTLAVLLTVSLIVTKFFFESYLISVWCFFAALISIQIIIILRKNNFENIRTELST